MLWCFLGDLGDQKGRNTNIFLKYGVSVCGRVLLWWWCPLVQRCAGVRGFRTCHRSALVLWWCVPCLLSALLHCACRVACKYGSISRFKGVLRGFYGADVCLYGFGFLRGLWGFCARVELGGLKACGVFASILSSFVLYLVLYFVLLLLCLPFFLSSLLLLLSLFLLSSACPLGCLASDLGLVFSLCGLLLFLFPLRMYAQKERAQSVVLCVLSCPVVCCFIWLLLYIPRTRLVSARLYRNKVLEKGNLTECSKLFCARLCSCLCSSKFVLFLFSYLLPLVGSYFLFPFGYSAASGITKLL